MKQALIAFCKKEGVKVVFGTENKVTVKEYENIKFPGKNTKEREELIEALKNLDRLDEVSELDVYALLRVFKNKEWDENDLDVLRRFETIEKSHRLTVSKK